VLQKLELEAEAGTILPEVLAIDLDDRCPADARPDQPLGGHDRLASDWVVFDTHRQFLACRALSCLILP
jgi:hypothetical protein